MKVTSIESMINQLRSGDANIYDTFSYYMELDGISGTELEIANDLLNDAISVDRTSMIQANCGLYSIGAADQPTKVYKWTDSQLEKYRKGDITLEQLEDNWKKAHNRFLKVLHESSTMDKLGLINLNMFMSDLLP